MNDGKQHFGKDSKAPVPAIRLTTVGRPESTHNGRSLRPTLSIRLVLCLGYSR